jgi:alcohol dehydrogenase class IV
MGYTFYCPTKIVVSENAAEDLVRTLGGMPSGMVLILTDAGVLKAGLAQPLIQAVEQSGRQVISFSDIPGNPNVPDVIRALQAAPSDKPATIVAIGGGSVIDTAKALGILFNHAGVDWEDLQWKRAAIAHPALPVIAIPTTAGTGSEVTHVAVIGDRTGFKMGVVHEAIFPRVAILDGALMASLPPNLTAATGMDALAHALEAYLGKRANPITDSFALAAMRDLVRCLPKTTHNGSNLTARRTVALAATLAGSAMDQAGLGLDHALCGPLANHYHLHHGLGVTVLLPATMDYNGEAIPAVRWAEMRAALGLAESTPPAALGGWTREFIRGLGLPTRIREIGIEPTNLDQMALEATRMAMIGNNIRAAGLEECKMVLEAAL